MRNYAENGELCGIMRGTGNCAISHSPHLNVASVGQTMYNLLTDTSSLYTTEKRDQSSQQSYQLYYSLTLTSRTLFSRTLRPPACK